MHGLASTPAGSSQHYAGSCVCGAPSFLLVVIARHYVDAQSPVLSAHAFTAITVRDLLDFDYPRSLATLAAVTEIARGAVWADDSLHTDLSVEPDAALAR